MRPFEKKERMEEKEALEGDSQTRLQEQTARRQAARKASKEEDDEAAVLAVRKRIIAAHKTVAEAEQAKEREALGPAGCLACMSKACRWKSSVDGKTVQLRLEAIADEINYIRENPAMGIVDSSVPLSAQRGGSTKFRRDDIMMELSWEARELNKRMRLDALDKEYHDACATRKEFMEVEALHGYRTVQWTTNARKALAKARDSLVASVVAVDIVDDILEWMLEGWVFGERESQFAVAGYVPSIRKDRAIRLGSEQIQASAVAQQKELERQREKAEGKFFPEDDQGTPFEKIRPIEVNRAFRLTEEKVVKAGSDRDKLLNETENTLRFGLFSLTFMYFRSMVLLQREKHSWSGKGDVLGERATQRHTAERLKIIQETRNAEVRQLMLDKAMAKARAGEERRRVRMEQERAEATAALYDKVRRSKQEGEAVLTMQRVYRGHLGRKAARRWCIKRAEMDAMAALLNAAVVTIQRVYRGWRGRQRAAAERQEIADFIAHMRTVDAREDEEDYWNTHPLEKLKRDVKLLWSKEDRERRARMQEVVEEEEEEEEGSEEEEEEEEDGGGDDGDDSGGGDIGGGAGGGSAGGGREKSIRGTQKKGVTLDTTIRPSTKESQGTRKSTAGGTSRPSMRA